MSENSVKRPVGMTILLVLSFMNACIQIFSNMGMYVTTPVMSQMMESGDLEEAMSPILDLMQIEGDALDDFWEIIENRLAVNPIYYLLMGLLYIGSLVGVLKMFKLQRVGFHVYSISQMLLLIVGVVFIYSKQGNNLFFNEFLMTIMFILIYHLYLKRIENDPQAEREQDF